MLAVINPTFLLGRCGHDEVRGVHVPPRPALWPIAVGVDITHGGVWTALVSRAVHRDFGVSIFGGDRGGGGEKSRGWGGDGKVLVVAVVVVEVVVLLILCW